MATVIDTLIIELGLDPRKLTQGQVEAVSKFKETQEHFKKIAEGIEEHGRRIGNSLDFFRTKALGIGAALVGAAGIEQFVQKLVTTDAQLAHTSRILGISSSTLSGWQAAAKSAGGTAEGITSAFENFNEQMTRFQYTGVPPELMKWTNSIGLDLRKGENGFKSANEVATELAGTMNRLGRTYAQQREVFRNVFGAGGDDLLKIVDRARRAGQSVDQYVAAQKRLRGVTDASVAAHERIMDAWGNAANAAEGLGRKLETQLEPHLLSAATRTQDLITKATSLFDIYDKRGWKGVFDRLQPEPIITPGGIIDKLFSMRPAGEVIRELFGVTQAHGATPPGGGAGLTPGAAAPPLPAATPIGGTGIGWWTRERQAQAVARLMQDIPGLPEVSARGLVARWAAVESTQRGPDAFNPAGGGRGAYGIFQGRGDRMPTTSDFMGQVDEAARQLMLKDQALALRRLMNAKTEGEAAQGAADFERAEGYNTRSGDLYVGKTVRAIPSVPSVATSGSRSTTDNSRTTTINVQNMNVSTTDPKDFAKQIQANPVLDKVGNTSSMVDSGAQ